MNDFVSQLLQLGPGIAAGATGNGGGMQAFMDAYQRTNAMLDENERRNQDMTMRQQQVTTATNRQQEQDRIAAEDRARQLEMQKIGLMPQLAELGGTGETPEDAQRMIETVLPGLMKTFGQDTMAYGQPAVEMASRTITARQKRQMKEFVESALKTSFVADNPESDPEVTNLPPHIVKVLGKPSAKLSELQTFAELPVGKPQGKTRIPPASGSFEEYSDPTTSPERKAQIEADRKKYMQSDDRPSVQVTLPGGISGKAGDAALKFQDDYARDSKPWVTIRDAYQRVETAAKTPDAAGDLSMIFAYMKMLDPNSVVREQEFANAQNAAGVPDRVRNLYNQVMQGTRLAPEQRQQFLNQARGILENAKANHSGVRRTYERRARQWGIPAEMVLDEADPLLGGAGEGEMIEAIDPSGKRHRAPKGTPLPAGWKLSGGM